mmetsp:Transcript_21705/g.45858  ORF Transcript_21705/g.45858 Transcript_21705/m.45858 type:complete len:266 (+) Transcript_21705:1659-2456(+)
MTILLCAFVIFVCVCCYGCCCSAIFPFLRIEICCTYPRIILMRIICPSCSLPQQFSLSLFISSSSRRQSLLDITNPQPLNPLGQSQQYPFQHDLHLILQFSHANIIGQSHKIEFDWYDFEVIVGNGNCGMGRGWFGEGWIADGGIDEVDGTACFFCVVDFPCVWWHLRSSDATLILQWIDPPRTTDPPLTILPRIPPAIPTGQRARPVGPRTIRRNALARAFVHVVHSVGAAVRGHVAREVFHHRCCCCGFFLFLGCYYHYEDEE